MFFSRQSRHVVSSTREVWRNTLAYRSLHTQLKEGNTTTLWTLWAQLLDYILWYALRPLKINCMFYLKNYGKAMRACEKTTQTVKKYANFLQCFLILFFTNDCILNKGRDKAQTILTKTHLLPPKRPVGWLLPTGMLGTPIKLMF